MPVVSQRADKVKRFIEETGFPFNILIDRDREVIRAYGVWQRFGFDAWNLARPAVFLIDSAGVIRYVFVGERQREFPAHEELMQAIDDLRD